MHGSPSTCPAQQGTLCHSRSHFDQAILGDIAPLSGDEVTPPSTMCTSGTKEGSRAVPTEQRVNLRSNSFFRVPPSNSSPPGVPNPPRLPSSRAPLPSEPIAEDLPGCVQASQGCNPASKQARSSEDLARRVKQLQRSNPVSKQAWHEFCYRHPTKQGVKDPEKHSSQDLQFFLHARKKETFHSSQVQMISPGV